MARPNLVDLLDVVYAVDAPAHDWQEGVIGQAVRVFPFAIGGLSYRYRLENGAPVLTSPVYGDTVFLGVPDEGHHQLDLQRIHRAYTAPSHAEPTKIFHADRQTGEAPAALDRMWGRLDCSDMFGVYATREGAESMTLGLAMPRASYPDIRARSWAAMSRDWTFIARHLRAALALREALSGEPGTSAEARPVAEFGENGQGDFWGGAEHHRAQLLDLARRAERARDDAPAGEGLPLWDQLLHGRWSIVRKTCASGRLRFLAVENPAADPLRALTPSERAVVERAAQGTANKIIAADLELSQSAVARNLGSALRKLGIDRRVHLALLARVLRHER